jgi:hypothetical protein
MDKNTKFEITDLMITLMILAAVMFMGYAFNKRIEVLECRLQVQTARIDLLNGLEITRPECIDELIGPLNKREAEKMPTKQT